MCLLAPWPQLLRLDSAAWFRLGPATTACAGLRLLCFLYNRFLTPAVTPLAGGARPPERPREPPPPRRRHWLVRWSWRSASWFVVYAAVPALLYPLRYVSAIDGHLDLFHEGEGSGAKTGL